MSTWICRFSQRACMTSESVVLEFSFCVTRTSYVCTKSGHRTKHWVLVCTGNSTATKWWIMENTGGWRESYGSLAQSGTPFPWCTATKFLVSTVERFWGCSIQSLHLDNFEHTNPTFSKLPRCFHENCLVGIHTSMLGPWLAGQDLVPPKADRWRWKWTACLWRGNFVSSTIATWFVSGAWCSLGCYCSGKQLEQQWDERLINVFWWTAVLWFYGSFRSFDSG